MKPMETPQNNTPENRTGRGSPDAACSAEGALAEAMQDVWNDHGEDCGEVPRCFDVKGPRTTRIYAEFEGSAFVHGVVALLAARGYTIQPNDPKVNRNKEPQAS